MCACECKWQEHIQEDHSNKKKEISKNDVRYVQNIGTIFLFNWKMIMLKHQQQTDKASSPFCCVSQY